MEDLPLFKTKILKNEDYDKNYEEMKLMVEELNKRYLISQNQGSPKSIEGHIKRGQLLGMIYVLK